MSVSKVGKLALWTAIVMLMSAGFAVAQGFYYKEIAKDGRIYVFNNAEEADRFEKSGEMGRSITRLNAGPNGETIVADSERALQLYFFKHGISEAVADPPPPPPPPLPFRISGLVFGDYYNFSSNHLATFKSQHGFWMRRAYLTYDQNFTPLLSMRLRLEMNSNGKLAGGAITPFVKDAYLRWTYHGRQQMTLGIQPSLSFDYVETVWGMRHIEKTPLDLYRWDSSRDFGATFSGSLNETQTVKYAAQYGNESGSNAETDKFKAYRFAVRYEMNPGFTVEGMYAHFDRDKNADRKTGQVFAAYRAKRGRAGFQYSFQKRQAADGSTTPDVDMKLVSAFAVADIKPQKTSAFLRVDRVQDPCPDCSGIDYLPIDTIEPFTFVVAGFEYYIHPSVRFSPNVEFVKYSTPEAGIKPKDDTVARLTFYWVW